MLILNHCKSNNITSAMYGKYYTLANWSKHGIEPDLHLITCTLKLIKPISRKQKLAIYYIYVRATAQGLSDLSKGISEFPFPSFPTVPTPRTSQSVLRGAQSGFGKKCCAQGHHGRCSRVLSPWDHRVPQLPQVTHTLRVYSDRDTGS